MTKSSCKLKWNKSSTNERADWLIRYCLNDSWYADFTARKSWDELTENTKKCIIKNVYCGR